MAESGMGPKFKESTKQEDDKDTVEHLLGGTNQQSPAITVIKRGDKTCDRGEKDFKPRLLWGIRRDAVLCTMATFILAISLLVTFIFLLVLSPSPSEEVDTNVHDKPVTAITRCGPVTGLTFDGSYAFLGIPYAEPPVRDLRFQKPIAMTKLNSCWTGIYHARHHKPNCFQREISDVKNVDFSEDCLYLDIYTPQVSYKNPLPVVVYFRGESSLGHDKNSIKLHPTPRLSRDTNMVYVTVTYRVHAFGFMALRTLRNKGHRRSSGNYGLHDMLTALEWVRDNVDSFGGNPRDVTVLGHGFSASAIMSLVMSPTARGLFNKAWMSGGATEVANASLAKAEENNVQFLQNIGCTSLHCLLHKTPQEIVEATHWSDALDLPFDNEKDVPIIVHDGEIVKESHLKTLRHNKFNDVNCIFGATSYSVGDWKHLDELNWTHVIDRVRIRLETIDDVLFNDAIANYLLRNEPVSLQYSKMVADAKVRCPIFYFARRMQNRFINDVFVYSSAYHQTSNARLDIAAILGQLGQFISPMTKESIKYQRRMQTMFTSYVTNNKLGLNNVADPPFYVNVNSGITFIDNKPDLACQLWFNYNLYPQYARHN